MNLLRSLQVCLKACCVIGKSSHLDKMNHDLGKMEKEIKERAKVDGEDLWFLRVERRKRARQ